MNFSSVQQALHHTGKEALIWAPVAIGLLTNNPTLITIGELGYAAFNLYTARNSTTKIGKLSAATNAAVSLITPFTYHPHLTTRVSTITRAYIALAIGGNHVIRGGVEISSVVKNAATSALARIQQKENPDAPRTSSYGKVIGNAFRFGLGAYRMYTGSNMIQAGLTQLSVHSAADETQPSEVDPQYSEESHADNTENPSSPSPKMDPKYAKEEILPRFKKKSVTPKNRPPKIASKFAKEEIHPHKNTNKDTQIDKCYPKKSESYHANDLAFYKEVADSQDKLMRSLKHSQEGRCEGTLYLRSEDTNYMHGKDGYVRAEDTSPIGEMAPEVAEQLIREGRVWYRTVEKVKDICKHINDIRKSGGKIKRLIIVGHGNKEEILLSQKNGNSNEIFQRFFSNDRFMQDFPFSRNTFSPFESFPFGNGGQKPFDFSFSQSSSGSGMEKSILNLQTQFPNECLSNLEPHADIVLISCSTGKQGGLNIADALALQAPGHRIIAPKSTVRMHNVKLKIANKLQIFFENKNKENITYTAFAKK